MENVKSFSVFVRVVVAVLLVVAIADQPYAYYQFLRIAVCVASIFLVWYFIKAKTEWIGYLFIFPAIIFNPIYPIDLQKETWLAVDACFAFLFFFSLTAYGFEKRIK